ncbi:CHASE2 domain-containing protein [Leptolyngbya sp. CCNP1308]|uniref:CHASE2 domain-containing protein n=1 Tax=Leptolyngbya sp. CCNP1308 TaxID=3110255 RepID=UPI002B216D53|nr:CHASE2 domain-containing protein [Leptolyngbya sp. CCNP1308]MEA5449225.1 CHASE2 domain-containing protein [Leptolyngbya sp. CCNP1308]
MQPLVVLNLGNGDWDSGCPSVVAQLWTEAQAAPMQWTGSLPPWPELGQHWGDWRRSYTALYAHRGWQRSFPVFEIDEDDITHFSPAEFEQLCRQVRHSLNRWLQSEGFRGIDQALRTHLAPTDEVRLIITAQARNLLRLPWHLWRFFDDYPWAEPALSLPSYGRAVKTASDSPSAAMVRILVVLGNAEGIDVERDRTLLERLPQASVTVLVEPDRATLHRHLWEADWEVLFFAGHSSSQVGASQGENPAPQGCLQINRAESLTLDDLRYGLRRAISHGLKLAIFNSCDGLGLAWDLADLHISQVIVMREPVPDRVAQSFLQPFLTAFANQQSLYQSVRLAREQLQGLEGEFPCASWLPIIYQNPAEALTPWQGWRSPTVPPADLSTFPTPLTVSTPAARAPHPAALLMVGLLTSLAVSSLVLGVRSVGMLQPLELWAFDRLQSLRPNEGVDDRFLVVTLTEADIQAQPQSERVGSLSDEALEQVLQALEPHQPRVIGLDIYRDRPTDPQLQPVTQALQQNDRLLVVCKSRDTLFDPVGIAPPPEVPANRVGFSDFIEDSDGVLRRQLVALDPDPASPCTAPYSFSARLAFRYLEDDGIDPSFTPDGHLQLGETIFRRVRPRWGGYQGIDAAGNQLMLNYRSLAVPHAIAAQVSLSQLLAGHVAPDAIRDRIVLLGITAPSAGDYWFTPFGSSRADRVAGVFVQAHMTSQLLSAVLDGRPMLWVWPLAGEALWLMGWGLVGSSIGLRRRGRDRSLAGVLALGILTGSSFILLFGGGWVPLVPAALVGLLAGGLAPLVYFKRLNL